MSLARSTRVSRRSRTALVAVAALASASLALTVPATEAAAATQPVSVVTSVNGVAGAQALSGTSTTVSFALTNHSTTGAKLGAFSIVVPTGVTGVTRAGIAGPGTWYETVLPCGNQSNCSAIILAAAGLPLSKTVVPPGGTVIASVNFLAPAVPSGATSRTLTFPLIGIGGGVFTASPSNPTVTVISGVTTSFDVSVAPGSPPLTTPPLPPIKAGVTASLIIVSRNGANEVPFTASSLLLTLGQDDAGASIGAPSSTKFTSNGVTYTYTLPVTPGTSRLTVPITFTAARSQSVIVDAGTVHSSSPGFDVAPGDPDSVRVDSVAGTSQSPTPSVVNVTQSTPFAVAFTVLDPFGNPLAPPATATLTSANITQGGVLTTSYAPSGDGKQGVLTTSVSKVQTGLTLTVGVSGLPSTSSTVNVGALSVTGTGGSTDTLVAGLPNGSFGPVSLTAAPCVPTIGAPCPGTTEYTLAGTFTSGTTHLYSNDHPASLTWTCTDPAKCQHGPLDEHGVRTLERGESSDGYLYNQGLSSEEQEQIEDYTWFPIYVALRTGGTDANPTYGPFGLAPPCSPLANHETGSIVDPEVAVHYCVDVYAIKRAANPPGGPSDAFTGALTIPVLFVEDPKMRP